jgi:O-antigen ligase
MIARGFTALRVEARFYRLAILAVVGACAGNLVTNPGLGVLSLCGIAAACLVFSRPDLGAWLVVILTPIETFGPVSFTVTKAAKLGLTALVALALLAGVFQRQENPVEDPFRLAFFLLLGTGLLATVATGSPLASALGLASLLIYVLFYTSLRCSKVLARNGARLLKVVVWISVPVAVLCIAQLTQGYGGFLGSREQQAMEADGQLGTIWPSIERASAFFNGPTAAGAFLGLAAVIAFAHAAVFRRFRLRCVLAALLCLLGILATFSRGALLGCLTGIVFSAWSMGLLNWRRVAFLLLPTTLALGILFADQGVKGYLRLGSDLVSVSASRFDVWKAAFVIIERHPVLGIGFYQFQAISQGIEGFSDTPVHAHNGFLKALVEQGPAGGFAYLLFLYAFVRTARRSLRVARNKQERWIFGSIAGVGVGLFTQELFDANLVLGGSSVAILFAALLGLQTSLLSESVQDACHAGVGSLATGERTLPEQEVVEW